MKMFTAKVVDGQLDIPAGALREGATVTLLVPEVDDEGFPLSPEEQARLRAAIAEAERGEAVDGWELLEDLES